MNASPKIILLALLVSFGLIFLINGFTTLNSRPDKGLTPPSEKVLPTSDTPPPPPIPADSRLTPQMSTGNDVTVTVTPRLVIPGKPPVFEVAYETHSVNLDFDAASVSTLTDDLGTVYGTASWDGSPPGGHHRNGTLTYRTPISSKVKNVTLTIRNVADIPERTLTWEVIL